MIESEIVDFLKDNKKNGIAFAFMPEEVRNWMKTQSITNFNIYGYDSMTHECKWHEITNPDYKINYENDVYCLNQNYELKSENKTGEWVEFDIDKNGDFEVCGIANDKNSTIIYNWSQWNKPIRDNAAKNFINGCCAFGGWLYGNQHEPIPKWYLHPCVAPVDVDGSVYTSYTDGDKKIKGIVPTKIRFWRIK